MHYLIFFAIIFAILFVGSIFIDSLRVVMKIVMNICLGFAAVMLCNMLLAPFDIVLGINPITLGIMGFLGVPGFLSLVALAAFL